MPTSLQRVHVTCQRSSGIWPRLLCCLARPLWKQRGVEGPGKLQQANYALRALPKGLKFLRVLPPSESPKVMGLVGIHDPDTLATSVAWITAPGVVKKDKMRGLLSTTFGWCTTGLAWCVTNVTTTCQPHQTPSAAMAGSTAKPLEREVPTSQPHPDNSQLETYGLISPHWESE